MGYRVIGAEGMVMMVIKGEYGCVGIPTPVVSNSTDRFLFFSCVCILDTLYSLGTAYNLIPKIFFSTSTTISTWEQKGVYA